MRKLWPVLLIFIFVGSIQSHVEVPDAIAWNPLVIGGGTDAPGGPTCDLLDDSLDGTNGVEVSTDADWTEDPATTNIFIYDTSIKNEGTSSCKVDCGGDKALSTAFTAAGQYFTVEFDVYIDQAVTPEAIQFLMIGDGGRGWGSTLNAVLGVTTDNSLHVWEDSETDTTEDITEETWTHIEIEMDNTNDQFSVWVGGGSEHGPYSYQAEANTTADTVYIYSGGGSLAGFVYIDDMCIYDGERQ